MIKELGNIMYHHSGVGGNDVSGNTENSPKVESLNHWLLTEKMMEITKNSYNAHWETYKNKYEWHTDMVARTRDDYFDFFVSQVPQSNGSKPKVLVPGCGSGRDVNQLFVKGFNVVAVDNSENMVNAAHSLAEGAIVQLLDIRNMRYAKKSFRGILMESAIQHIPKDQSVGLLKGFSSWLANDGIMLVRFKLTKHGNVIKTVDDIGERYFSTYREKGVRLIIKALSSDMEYVGEKLNPHVDSEKPSFLSIAFRKKRTKKDSANSYVNGNK